MRIRAGNADLLGIAVDQLAALHQLGELLADFFALRGPGERAHPYTFRTRAAMREATLESALEVVACMDRTVRTSKRRGQDEIALVV